MDTIDLKIERLREEIVTLEKTRDVGYAVETSCDEEYYLSKYHTTLRDLEGDLIAIIADETAVRKYLSGKLV